MRNVVISLIVVILIMGCAKEQTKYADITFNVDKALLGEEYICPKPELRFQLPKDWEQISPDMLASIRNKAQVSQDTTNVYVVPIDVFMDMQKSFTCFLSTFDSKLLAVDVMQNYLDEFRIINQDVNLNEGSFAHNGLDFQQITFAKDDLITVKLITIINDQELIMIDYIVPSKYYEEELRSIESSIGSIKIK